MEDKNNITSLEQLLNDGFLGGDEERNEERVEECWSELITQITNGNVIPVIGPDLLTKPKDGKNFHQRLIDCLAKWGGIDDDKEHPVSFSQVLYDGNFLSKLIKQYKKKDGIYKLLNQLLGKVSEPAHPLLIRLLKTKRFPFVITTSFTPVVENCMREIYGQDNVRVLQFNNDSQRSMRVGFGDIQNEKEMMKPTVFYMFGKVSAEPHRYVVTDLDMMDFCRTWLSGMGIPRNLTENLKKRYLLFMGGSYSDWLFRFIWYSMRHGAAESHKASMFVMPESQNSNLSNFEKFLERLEAFTQHDPEAVINQIEQRLAKIAEAEKLKQASKQESGYDVFLSYSRRDIETARYLYEELEKRGINVWFDKQAIREAENWKNALQSGIRQSKLFVPLLTRTITQEFMEPHEYRDEWAAAADIAKRMGARAFIIPIAESDFDFYDPKTNLPVQFTDLNAKCYTTNEELSEAADVIQRILEELNELLNNA